MAKQQPAKRATEERALNLAAYEKTARRVADLLADPDTPAGLRIHIDDYLLELENTTQINARTPEVLATSLPLMFEVYDALELDDVVFSENTNAYLRQRRAVRNG